MTAREERGRKHRIVAMPSDAQLKALFTSFDTSGDGFIDKAELTAALQKGGKKVTQEDVDEMIKAVDKNADNQVDFEEFKAVFEMAPDKLTALGLNALVDVTGALLGGLTVVGGAVINTPRALVGGVGSFVGSMGSKLGLSTGESGFVDIKDTNVAGIGSEEDKEVRKAAAEKEAAWEGAGKAVGLEVWRVEKFKLVKWPKEQYGQFYEGDSYIILHTYKETPSKPKLVHDVYFWLGKKTTQDEMVSQPVSIPSPPVGSRCPLPASPLFANPDVAGSTPASAGHRRVQDRRVGRPARWPADSAPRGHALRVRPVQVPLQGRHLPQGRRRLGLQPRRARGLRKPPPARQKGWQDDVDH